MSKAKYKKQHKMIILIINNKIKVAVGVQLSREKKMGFIIPSMNCYPAIREMDR